MLTVAEMIPVAEVVKNYPEGTLLKVWFKNAGGSAGRQYAGLFTVGSGALYDAQSGAMWGELMDEVLGMDGRRPVYIVRVEHVEAGAGETVRAQGVPRG